MSIAGIVGLIACVVIAMQDAPVEGDLDLLETLRKVQRENADRYPHGRLKAEMEERIAGEGVRTRCSATLWWDGDRRHTTIEGERFPGPRDGGREKPGPWPIRSIKIEDGSALRKILEARGMTYDPLAYSTSEPMTSAHPLDWWYGRVDRQGRPWIEHLGPHPAFPQTKVLRYTVARLDDDRVAVVRLDKTGTTFRLVASLALDGQIVEANGATADGRQRESRRYTWARDPQGRLYVKEMEVTRLLGGVESTWTYRTLQFDADARPAAALFADGPTGPRFLSRPGRQVPPDGKP